MDAIGAHAFWGISPALDVQQLAATAFGTRWPTGESGTATGAAAGASDASDGSSPAAVPLCILMAAPGDIRHVLKTVAQRRRSAAYRDRPLHFFVHERNAGILARDLVLLAAATDAAVPLRQRAATWLEVYGNALVQARTSRYMTSTLLPPCVSVVVGEPDAAPEPLRSSVDVMGHLKAKQRDDLEDALKACRDGVVFDMVALRDARCRHHYGTRYDFRGNLIDWDYQTGVRPYAGGIHFSQFKAFRESGVGFEFGDQVYDVPNRTLASYAEGRERGMSVMRRGYWGDIVVSPFHAVGTAAYVPTDDEAGPRGGAPPASTTKPPAAASTTATAVAAAASAPSKGVPSGAGNYAYQLFDIVSRRMGSEQWRHHAVEVATYNVLSWLHEMETGSPYVMRLAHDIYSGLSGGTESSSSGASASAAAAAPAAATTAADSAATAAAVAAPFCEAFAGVTISLIGGDFEETVLGRSRYKGLFHVITLSGRAVHLMEKPGFDELFAPQGCVVVAETARNVVTMREAQREEFTRRVVAMAALRGLVPLGSDRELSADTYSVGTVIGSEWRKSGADSGGGGSTGAARFTRGAAWLGAPAGGAGVGAGAGVSGRSTSAGAVTMPDGSFLRAKTLPFAAYIPERRVHPTMVALDRVPASEDSASLASHAAVRDAATRLRDLVNDAGPSHDVEGGDNPPPEAIVFAALPQSGVRTAIAAAAKPLVAEALAAASAAAARAAPAVDAAAPAGASAPTPTPAPMPAAAAGAGGATAASGGAGGR